MASTINRPKRPSVHTSNLRVAAGLQGGCLSIQRADQRRWWVQQGIPNLQKGHFGSFEASVFALFPEP